jgi:hypothetical protein
LVSLHRKISKLFAVGDPTTADAFNRGSATGSMSIAHSAVGLLALRRS